MNRWLRGCAFAVVLLIGSCIVCTHTDAWERFNGSELLTGIDSLQVTGDSSFAWNGGGASMSRTSAMVASDGYSIELDGPRAYELLGLSTTSRPHEGTFRVVRDQFPHKLAGDFYTALMSLSNDTRDFYSSDSGSIVVSRAESGLDGRYVVYASTNSTPRTQQARHFVVRGVFHLRRH